MGTQWLCKKYKFSNSVSCAECTCNYFECILKGRFYYIIITPHRVLYIRMFLIINIYHVIKNLAIPILLQCAMNNNRKGTGRYGVDIV